MNVNAEVKSMDLKKTDESSSVRSFISAKKAQDFIAEIKSEIFKINWSTREELLTYTKIVVVATFVFGMAIYGTDLAIQGSLNILDMILRFIAG